MKKSLLCLFIIIFFNGCGACNNEKCIDFYNNSNKKTSMSIGWKYPDTTLENNHIRYFMHPSVFSFQKRVICEEGHASFEGLFLRQDTAMLFLFDDSVIENTDWKIVEKDYLVLQRYDLSLQDLEKLNWKVYYPPTEAMKDMKMFPPYQEKKDDTE